MGGGNGDMGGGSDDMGGGSGDMGAGRGDISGGMSDGRGTRGGGRGSRGGGRETRAGDKASRRWWQRIKRWRQIIKRIRQYLQHEHYALWEVIEFGNSYKAPPEETAKDKGLAGEVSSSTKKKGRTVAINVEDMQKRKNDEAILKTFGGNENTKKTKKNQLKQQYGNFKAEGSETLEQTFNRLQAIVSHLEFMDVPIEHDDLNQKFLTSLAPEWLIDDDDIEEMDIKWNLALLSLRADRSPRSQDRGKRESYKKDPKVEEPAPKAMIAIDVLKRDIELQDNEIEYLKNELKEGIPQHNIDDKGYWDSGCSRHMTGNISYLSKYEPFIGGYVLFGHGRGKITGKGSINTGKFNAKGDEGYFVGYSLSSKAFRVFNKRTKKIEENLHVDFLENKFIEKGTGPDWLFDIDTLTNSMNYVQVVVTRTSSTNISSTKEYVHQAVKEKESPLRLISLPNWFHEAQMATSNAAAIKDDAIPEQQEVNRDNEVPKSSGNLNSTVSIKVSTNDSFKLASSSTVETKVPTVSTPVPTDNLYVPRVTLSVHRIISKGGSSFPKPLSLGNAMSFENMLEDFFGDTSNAVSLNEVEVDLSNMETAIQVSLTITLIIHKDHPKSQIIGHVDTHVQTRKKTKNVDEQSFIAIIHQKTNPDLLQYCLFSCFLSQEEPKKIVDALKDPSWPPGFQDPEFLHRFYKVEKAMYGLHQALRAWYGTLSKYLLDNDFQRDDKVADLLTKDFDEGRFQYLVVKHNTDFHQIVDFLEASYIRVETTDGETKILAKVNGRQRIVFDSSIRRHLKLNDEEGISTLPDNELFENLSLMGYNILPNQSNIATALVCLATNRTYNFSKMIFDGMMRNVKSKGKFLVYPRFIEKLLKMSQFGVIKHTEVYSVSFHTQKVFSTLRVNSLSFSGKTVELFASMLVPYGKGSEHPFEPHHIPSYQDESIHHEQITQSPQHAQITSHEPIPQSHEQTISHEPTLPSQSHSVITIPKRITRGTMWISQSKVPSPGADETSFLTGDVRYGEAFPTVTRLDAGLQRQHSLMEERVQSQDLEITQLKTRVKTFKDNERGREGFAQEDAPNTRGWIKGRIFAIFSIGVSSAVTTASGSFPTAVIFTTASVATPTTRVTRSSRGVVIGSSSQISVNIPSIITKDKGKGKMTEPEQPSKEKIARIHAKRELKMMTTELDKSNEMVAKYLSEYEQAEAGFSHDEKVELIDELLMHQRHLAQIKKYQA
nr:hypothetical protein [Tanacetum cinerariifolium]